MRKTKGQREHNVDKGDKTSENEMKSGLCDGVRKMKLRLRELKLLIPRPALGHGRAIGLSLSALHS